jgi:hypothetical protein
MTDTLCFRLTVDSEVNIFQVKKPLILTYLGLFQEQASLLDSGEYTVQSVISADIFGQFANFLEGESIEITTINFPSLQSLSEEFDFQKPRDSCVSFEASNQASMNSDRQSQVFQIEDHPSVLGRSVIDLRNRVQDFEKEMSRLTTMFTGFIQLFESEQM